MWVVVLAGGGGTRLWPLSREEFPKQFLHFGDGESLLQKTVGRFLNAPLTDELVVATNHRHAPLVEKQLHRIDPQKRTRILLEPSRRNTAAAIAYAARYMQEKLGAPDSASFIVLPSDHLIEPASVFLQTTSDVENFLRSEKGIVTFGIRPTRPETGFGYIQVGSAVAPQIFKAKAFVEKPNIELATQYLHRGDYYWNAGIFALTFQTLWEELFEHAPELYHLMQRPLSEVEGAFDLMPNLSFDYAVMEKSRRVFVAPLAISWSDVGSWDSVYETLPKDHHANVKIGDVLDIDTKNSLIMGGRRLISTIGLEDLLIVETEEATFIAKKGESQRVRALVEEMTRRGKTHEQKHNVKPLYMTDHAVIETVTIHPSQSLDVIVEPKCRDTWSLIRGEIFVENEGPLDLIRREGPATFRFTNRSQETAELLHVAQSYS